MTFSQKTWEYDGNTWTDRTPASPALSPAGRRSFAFAFDPVRGVAILFGGDNGAALGDTWEWDSAARSWTQLSPTHSPVGETRIDMAYEATLGMVLFTQHYVAPSVITETWVWNGSGWIKQTPAADPGRRDWAELIYDTSMQKVILMGGYNYQIGAPSADIWVWDPLAAGGATWYEVSSQPMNRNYHAMAYDSNRNETILFGGSKRISTYQYLYFMDTWRYDSSGWTQLHPLTNPPKRIEHKMVYDSARQRVVLFGGYGPSAALDDTWEWDGTNWTEVSPASPALSPAARTGFMMAYDAARNETILYGGAGSFSDTWAWNGTVWTEKTPASNPGNWSHGAMTYDPARQVIVLYGGNASTATDTWEWDGNNWTQKSLTPNPGGTQGNGFVYNAQLGVPLMFDGYGGGKSWTYDGTEWRDLSAGSISQHYYGAMVHDIFQEKTIYFGGTKSVAGQGWYESGETWEFSLADGDGDGTPDCLDNCPTDPAKTEPGVCGCLVADHDSDGDGTLDCIDNCDNDPLKTEPGICGCGEADIDTDGDGAYDCDDECINDPDKIQAGVCGCGTADTDTDSDGMPDCNDECPADPAKVDNGICGCGVSDTDTDKDGSPDCTDSCPSDSNKVAEGICGCGLSDQDRDGDGAADCNDGCPDDANKKEPGVCGCGASELSCQEPDPEPEPDNCPNDPEKSEPGVCGCGIADSDLNQNGIIDCLSTQELHNQLTVLQKLIKKVRKIPAKAKKAKKKKVRFAKKQLRIALTSLRALVAAQGGSVVLSDASASIIELENKYYKAVKKALRTRHKKWKKFKKSALKATKEFSNALTIQNLYYKHLIALLSCVPEGQVTTYKILPDSLYPSVIPKKFCHFVPVFFWNDTSQAVLSRWELQRRLLQQILSTNT